MLGYLIVARYVDAWHVMNVAVDEPWRGRGVARQMLERPVRDDRRTTSSAATRSRCASPTTPPSASTAQLGFVETGIRRGYYTDNREDALIMWRDPSPQRDPRHRELMRRDRGRDRRRGRNAACQRGRVASRTARALRRGRARGGVAPAPGAVRPGRRGGAGRGRGDAGRRGRRRRHRGPGPDRCAARRPGHRQVAGLRPAAALDPGRPSARPRRRRSTSSPIRSTRPSCCCSPPAATRCWPRWTIAGRRCTSSARRSTTPPERRSTRAPAYSGWATPAAPRWSGWPARATPPPTSSPSPWPAVRGWTCRSAASRPPCARQ